MTILAFCNMNNVFKFGGGLENPVPPPPALTKTSNLVETGLPTLYFRTTLGNFGKGTVQSAHESSAINAHLMNEKMPPKSITDSQLMHKLAGHETLV